MIFTNTKLLLLQLVLVPSVAGAFRPVENPTGLEGLKTPLVLKKPPATPPTVNDSQNVITAKTMEQVGRASAAKRTDKEAISYEDEYWYDPRIHNFGNVGFLGAIHAVLAPISTKVIDEIAYDGQDIRSIVSQQLSNLVTLRNSQGDRNPRVLDMCCGTGISTRALQDVFPDSELVVGLDTSSEMISMANFATNRVGFLKPIVSFVTNKMDKERQKIPIAGQDRKFPRRAKFTVGNAERTNFPSKSFDLVTVMYAFHEVPKAGRERIIREAYRVLQPGGTLAIVDISTDYTPSETMLSGEPYVLEYQKNIHRQLRSTRGFSNLRYKNVVQDHVGMWTMKRTN